MKPIEEITMVELIQLIEQSAYTNNGLPVIEYDDCVYLIAMNDEEADEAVKDYISESLWAFNECFMSDMTGIDLKVFVAFAQSNLCESANDAILSLVEKTCGLDKLVEAAIDADGRGHFLSGYDGEEIELECGAFAYRN